MSSDPNKKTARTFQCRDVLWDTFEQMARELECSVDYLVNEAMKQYARQRNYGGRTSIPGGGRPQEPGMPPGTSGASAPPPLGGIPQRSGGSMPMPPPHQRGPGVPARSTGSLPVPPARGASLTVPTPPPRGMGYSGPTNRLPAAPGRSPLPPPLPRGISAMPPPMPGMGQNPPTPSYGAPGMAMPPLSVIYQGDKVPIHRERFVIGRGKQSSDLTLKDPNVSRQHAMVEYQNGVFFMVDMGSTNGVEYNGQRIARKQIAEGDVFRICDHDLYFTYR